MTLAKASPSIVAAAIVAIIGSLLVILTAGIGLLGTFLVRTGTTPTPQPPGARTMSLVILAVFGAFGILGISSAVGIWRLRNWARLSFLIYSGVMIPGCVFGLAVVWLILPSLPNVEPRAATFMRVFMVIIYGIPAVIGVWWLILFTRKDIARQFQTEPIMTEDGVTLVPAKPACPLPIAILAGFSLVSVCFMPMLFLMPAPIPVLLFGHAIFGRPALAVYVLLSVTMTVSSIGLLQLRKWSYPLAIGCQLFGCVNWTVTLLNPKSWTIMNGIVAKMQTPAYPGGAFSYSHNQYLATSAGGLLFAIAMITMVLYYRTAFYEQSDRKRNLNTAASLPPASSPTTPPALVP